MFTKKKIKTPLFFTIFFVLITFTIPMTLYAGPSAKCPCFTAGEISRDISKADGFANCKYFDTRDGSGGGDFGAQIFITPKTEGVQLWRRLSIITEVFWSYVAGSLRQVKRNYVHKQERKKRVLMLYWRHIRSVRSICRRPST